MSYYFILFDEKIPFYWYIYQIIYNKNVTPPLSATTKCLVSPYVNLTSSRQLLRQPEPDRLGAVVGRDPIRLRLQHPGTAGHRQPAASPSGVYPVAHRPAQTKDHYPVAWNNDNRCANNHDHRFTNVFTTLYNGIPYCLHTII